MKLAFVVQRYGKEIIGGSESLARQIAERLSRRHDITVLTTTAKDYLTWKNEYPVGTSKQRGVTVTRFPVLAERDIDAFNEFSKEIYEAEPTREDELKWLHKQGPVVPDLVEHLKKDHGAYELILFFTYLYYPTFYGLQIAPSKSLLLPTAHDEPPLKLGIFKDMFQLPDAFILNTEAEELLVLERFPVHKRMRETIGMGLDLLEQPDPAEFRKKHDLGPRYLLYAGRIDAGKSCDEMIRFFQFYKEENPSASKLELVLIGTLGMKLPEDGSIRYLGFVEEAEKLAAMAGAVAVLMPSRMESLSIVTLEAFSVSTPVVAHGASQVVLDHCRKSNAGLYYRDFEEFEGILDVLLKDKNLGRSLGRNGQRYVKENYGWTKLLDKYEKAFLASGRTPVKNRDPIAHEYPLPPTPSAYLSVDELLSEEELEKARSIEAEAPSGGRRGQRERSARGERGEAGAGSGRRSSRGRRPAPDASELSEEAEEVPTTASSRETRSERVTDAGVDSKTRVPLNDVAALAGVNAASSDASATERPEPDREQSAAEEQREFADSQEGQAGRTKENVAARPETTVRFQAPTGELAGPDDDTVVLAPSALPGSPVTEQPEPVSEDSPALSEDTEHLPSFFRRSIPDKPAPPLAPPSPKREPEAGFTVEALKASDLGETDGTLAFSAPPSTHNAQGEDPGAHDTRDTTSGKGLPSFFRSTVPKPAVSATPVPPKPERPISEPSPDVDVGEEGTGAPPRESQVESQEGELPKFFQPRTQSPSEDSSERDSEGATASESSDGASDRSEEDAQAFIDDPTEAAHGSPESEGPDDGDGDENVDGPNQAES